ncbi:MAG: tRNA pseudouridine(38-40) synthase TruA [Firmicutes bacterium]|nr:tRNA pseudouridine(38-40) synthase TruA [Bacillota bacterium]MDD7602600.1 tRNA pseudouridine(38-40) synthase TruA [Bacillota bacterium]MDY5855706.1 tRNA pseudouridine(38-40) synthase TruA [Anaerovoracaceae bacterium]
MERNLLLKIEYDGSEFFGWQRQPGVRTVQGTLEEALSCVLGTQVQIQGTSRTDAGVHALAQHASLCGTFGIPTERIAQAVNNRLAGKSGGIGKIGRVGDVRILSVNEMPTAFHARFSSLGKRYRYLIGNSRETDIFRRRYCYQVTEPLDAEAMRAAARCFVGTHDFAAFQTSGGTPRQTTVRTIYSLTINRQGDDLLLEVTGDGFLYNMVRILTGTLVEVGLGRRNPGEMNGILESCDRQEAGHTAPPQGLYLAEVFYTEDEIRRAQQENENQKQDTM